MNTTISFNAPFRRWVLTVDAVGPDCHALRVRVLKHGCLVGTYTVASVDELVRMKNQILGPLTYRISSNLLLQLATRGGVWQLVNTKQALPTLDLQVSDGTP